MIFSAQENYSISAILPARYKLFEEPTLASPRFTDNEQVAALRRILQRSQ
jgi:hypothetical protein